MFLSSISVLTCLEVVIHKAPSVYRSSKTTIALKHPITTTRVMPSVSVKLHLIKQFLKSWKLTYTRYGWKNNGLNFQSKILNYTFTASYLPPSNKGFNLVSDLQHTNSSICSGHRKHSHCIGLLASSGNCPYW